MRPWRSLVVIVAIPCLIGLRALADDVIVKAIPTDPTTRPAGTTPAPTVKPTPGPVAASTYGSVVLDLAVRRLNLPPDQFQEVDAILRELADQTGQRPPMAELEAAGPRRQRCRRQPTSPRLVWRLLICARAK